MRVFYPSAEPKKAAQRVIGFAVNDIQRAIAGDTTILPRTLALLLQALETLDVGTGGLK